MQIAETVTFGGSGLDRAAELRGDKGGLLDAFNRASTRCVVIWRGKPLFCGGDDAKLGFVSSTAKILAYADEAPTFIGLDDIGAIFAYDISGWEPEEIPDTLGAFFDPSHQTHPDLPKDHYLGELRGVMAQLSPRDAEIAATAKAILGWHETHAYCAKCGEKTSVMGGFWGSNLGVIDLMLERSGNEWQVVTHAVETRPISKRNEDRSVSALVESTQSVLDAAAKDHTETLAYIRRAVGKTSAPLHSYFALVADDPSVQIVSIAQKWYIEEMMKGTEYEGIPILSAAAPFKAGGRGGAEYYTDVPKGDVAIKNVADLYLYPNTARAVLVDGAQLRGWLERSAGMFNQVNKGEADQILLNPDFPSYNFDVIDGVEYQIDISQPMMFNRDGDVINADTKRIVNLTFEGAPVTDDMKFVIATNNYRAGGGGSFPGTGDTTIFEGPDTNRDVIVRYIVDQGTINPTADGNWSFLPLADTSVLFDTGPKATDYIDDLKGIAMEEAGDGPDGFARFRIKM